MASSIVPLGDVSGHLVRDFLRRFDFDPHIIEWKYFDAAFNRGRSRGYVWLHRDRVGGMIGLIPFAIAAAGQAREVQWSCDWMLADPLASPGIGILLLKRALATGEGVIGLGGNENTRKLIPRLATRTVPDAASTLHLFLRSGALLEKLERRLARVPLRAPGFLRRLPLRWIPRSGRDTGVRTETGVAPTIGPLLESDGGPGWHPRYDFDYVDWQVGRCPTLVSGTSYAPGRTAPDAAAVYWRPRSSNTFWRMAVWWNEEHPDRLDAVVREAISRVYEHGGAAVSVIASRSDAPLIGRLEAAGFVALGRPRAVYLCAGAQSTEPLPELRGLSYLDTDLGYRFYEDPQLRTTEGSGE
jgi:hypothetical protein